MQQSPDVRQLVRLLATICVMAILRPMAFGHTASAEHFMLATVHPIATDAGVEVFRAGGNAVDAAVTAALTLGLSMREIRELAAGA